MNFLVNVQNIFGKYSYKETHISKFTKVKLSKLLENTKFTSFKKNKDVTNLNDKCWERLKSMAFETYVPESETSKSRAGY